MILLIVNAGNGLWVWMLVAGLIFGAACAQPTIVPTVKTIPATSASTERVNPTEDLIATPTGMPADAPATAVPATTVPATTVPATAVPAPTATALPTPEPELNRVRLVIIEGSEARYLVKEQFARRNIPNDAIGKTREVTGAILFDATGAVVPEESLVMVDLSVLRSDDDDRDDYLKGESLESEQFPFAELMVRDIPGLPWPLPAEGEFDFQLQGDMTIHGNTSPLLWEVTAQFAPDQIVGTAKTNFDFNTFHLVRPSKFFLLSVEDDIRLELDFVVSVVELGG